MEGRRFRNVLALLVISVLGLTVLPASAGMITLDFDDIDPAEGSVAEQNFAGFQWGSRWTLGNTDMSTAYKDVGSPSSQFLYNSGQTRNLVVERDTPFDFYGAKIGAPSTTSGPFSRAYELIVTAKDVAGEIIGQPEYWLFYENSFHMDVVFTGVTKLEFFTPGGIFTMNDFSYKDIDAEVNEAGGLILLGIGLVGLWAARRRVRA